MLALLKNVDGVLLLVPLSQLKISTARFSRNFAGKLVRKVMIWYKRTYTVVRGKNFANLTLSWEIFLRLLFFCFEQILRNSFWVVVDKCHKSVIWPVQRLRKLRLHRVIKLIWKCNCLVFRFKIVLGCLVDCLSNSWLADKEVLSWWGVAHQWEVLLSTDVFVYQIAELALVVLNKWFVVLVSMS